MEILVKKCLMPLALKTQDDSLAFIHELKKEMHADLKYVESLEDELDELESDKAEFSNMYDMLLQECVSKDVMCSYLLTSSDLDEITELQCLYLHKVMECDCLAQKLSEQTDFVSKEIYTELLQRFARLEKHSISLEIALQECQVRLKNDTVCKEKASNVFRKEREQYVEIQDLKAQLQDKNMAISELKKLVAKCKGKSVDTKFDKQSVVRQPNAQRIPKPSVLGKPAPLIFQTLGVAHNTNVSRPQPRSNQMKGKVVPNTSHVKFKKTEVEEHPRISKTSSPTLISLSVLMAKSNTNSKHGYVHRRLSHLKLPTTSTCFQRKMFCDLVYQNEVFRINYVSCEVSKAKRSSFKSKTVPSSKGRLNLLHMDLCGPMRDETPEVLKDFLTMIQRNLQALVIFVRTDRGTEFLNKTLNAFFKEEGIEHQTSTPRTPEQNGVVERRNRTLVEAARTMLSASKLPLFFWAEAIATACYTQNRSIIIPTHEKTAYHIINDRKPSIKHLHIFGCTCYLTRDGENLDKMKEKGDSCILVGYSTQSKGYLGLAPPRQMTSDHNSSELEIHDHSNELSSSKLVPKVVPPADKTATSRQELELLFHHHITMLRSYALSWKPCQGDSLNLPDHRIHKDGDGDASFQLESNSLPHAHAQTTKTYYKHQDSRIMKAQELKTKTSAQTLIYKIFLQRYQVYQGRLLASFQDDAKYEHVGQDTRSQGGKDDQDKQGKDLKISDEKDKVKRQ
ncbi:retrovirus-related pol polyprotein from transposon TNT 1-94 [Tanacetum coccineum]